MQIALISVPSIGAELDRGQLSGLERAADAYIAAGLVSNLGSLGIDVVRSFRPVLPDTQRSIDPIVNLGRANALVAQAVVDSIAAGAGPVLAGGTCSHLIGMMAGLQRSLDGDARLGLIWLDAHGDFNTPRTTRSGMLGGMPVAVSAGLCLAPWRELAGMTAPLPTNRILLVDVRNLDPAEETLIAATDASVAKFEPRFGCDAIVSAIHGLSDRVDHLYLHVDADILDATLQPNHPTVEPGGPDVAAVLKVLSAAFGTGKVRAFGVVSVNPTGADGQVSLSSGMDLITGGVTAWATYSARL